MNSINKSLERYQKQIIRKQRLENMTKNMLKEKQELESKTNLLKEGVKLEGDNENRFEEIRLSSLFKNIYNIEEGTDGEKIREIAAIQAKYDLSRKELQDLDKYLVSSYNEFSCLQGCERRYIDSVMKKAKVLDEINYEDTEELMELENKIIYLDGQKREMTAAVEIGLVALRAISSVHNGVESIRSWGTADILRKDMEVINKKGQYLDSIQTKLCKMQLVLRRFSIELNDVNLSLINQVEVSEFLNFADKFLEGVFMEEDLRKHSTACKIQVKQIYDKVSEVIAKLKANCSIIDKQIAIMNIKYKELNYKLIN